MNRLKIYISFLLVAAIAPSILLAQQGPIQPGASQLHEYVPPLKGKKVGLVVNQTSTINDMHLVDKLLNEGVDLKKVFAPEHGFRGDVGAGEIIKDGKDRKSGLPLISLYGKNKKPTPQQLDGIDVMIFDIQDVGTRFYTYISTMHYVMEACAENNKKLIVLDRPNPNGMYVDGPMRAQGFKSFVGMHPIPIVHGLTVGELALMINGEGWLTNKAKCPLEVIKVKGYTHKDEYTLPVSPSPNLPNDLSVRLYPSLCLFEGTPVSAGRGTTKPFQQLGYPGYKNKSYSFKPISIPDKAKHPKYENEICFGINFSNEKLDRGFSLHHLIAFYKGFDDKENFFKPFFRKLAGTSELEEQIKAGLTEKEIKASWEASLSEYKKMRKKYLLYPDFE